ncbi:hypothetical protein [Mucilaginibacter boryungensis]|uniref:Bacteriocin immunity protein n=1 Tax=Mucilaginibacter boryungensis TaxID=768480 RepID=A0ABR9XFN7_9SPHI|nr:hypothetical protein [Mucilaginibacter boryungensis]MBE9666218.1 hypothetical protein [Mucilaginibacter boryungensis]
MNNKFYYVYLIAGSIALILFIYQLFMMHSTGYNLWNMSGDIFLTIVLYYLAFKTYHEKKDKELM